MSWGGSMQVIVTDETGGPITQVSVSHRWTDGGSPESISCQSMALHESVPFEIVVGSGGSDEWTVALVDVSGQEWGRQNKQCNVKEEDYDSHESIRIQLGLLNEGWSVYLPKSSSCIDNYYDEMGEARLQPSFNWNYDAEVLMATLLSMVPEVGSILSGLVYIFWPSSGQDVWTQVEQQTAQLIQQQISQQVFQQVVDTLTGLQSVLNDYLLELNTGDLDEIRDYWTAADVAFDENLPAFQEPGYQLLLLPLFAQVANLELSLLRDGVLFGAEWGWNQKQVETVQTKLTQNISEFQTYAEDWYQQGYNQVVLGTQQNYHKCEPFLSVNGYVRQMTLSVLDFMNLWPYLDPSVYPNTATPYLDREIYSDPVGTCDDSGAINLPTPPTQPILQMTIWGGDRIDAAQLTYPAGGGPGGVTQTSRMGDQNGGTNQPPYGGVFTLSDTVQVVEVGGFSGDILNAFSFTLSDGTQTGKLGGGNPGGTAFSFSYPGQIMSSLHINGISDAYGTADCAVFGFKYQGYGPLTCITLDGATWSADVPVGTISSPATPSSAEFKGLLYCAYQGTQAGSLWYATFDGATWHTPQLVQNVGISEGPSLAVYDGLLYFAHQGSGGSGQLWYSVFDGSDWQDAVQIENVALTGSPSLVVSNNRLFCIHQGAAGAGELWYSVFDGTSWLPDVQVPEVALTGSPSGVVFNDQLYCFYQGLGGGLWYSVFDGATWQNPQLVPNVGMSESPAAVVVGEALYVLHKGLGTSTELWCSIFEGTSWRPDQQVSGATLVSSPSAALFNGILYCLHEGQMQAPSPRGMQLAYVSAPRPLLLGPDDAARAEQECWEQQRQKCWANRRRLSQTEDFRH